MTDSEKGFTHWPTDMRRVAEGSTLAAAALRYANLGIPLFPCVPGGKQPLTANGFHDATTSAQRVAQWWKRNPDANIGLPTGARTEVVVVDIDVHGEQSGYPAFERARSARLADGWAWLVRTPSGGLYAYYPATPHVEQRCWQAPSTHVDFRGDGGYIIAPPSRIEVDGTLRQYQVIVVANHPPKALDATALREFLEPPRRHDPPPALPRIGASLDNLARFVSGLHEGERNHGLFWAACRAAETGHRQDQTQADLGQVAQAIGLPEREVASTISSAYRIAGRCGPAPSTPDRTRSTRRSAEAVGM
jgi:hypothetical protein